MRYNYLVLTVVLISTSCATLNDSLQLGGALGTAVGAVAVYSGYSAGGKHPSLGTVAVGAGIGSALGTLIAFVTHRKVEEQRGASAAEQTEMHFGDLPPSPFIVPKLPLRKEVR